MKFSFAQLRGTQKAALLVGALGLFAAFAGSPYRGARYTVDATELGRVVQSEVDHVAPAELADWIVQGKTDFRLIDLRTEQEYSAYHIPNAERVSLAALADYNLQKTEKIILYSEGGIHSAQAWFLLKARGYTGVYMLFGGLEEWKDAVLFPALPANATPEQQKAFAKAAAVSRNLGGSPRSGVAEKSGTPELALPKLETPQGSAVPAAGTTKKKKEGC
jgi:rhodanese-related sulfurtransferase